MNDASIVNQSHRTVFIESDINSLGALLWLAVPSPWGSFHILHNGPLPLCAATPPAVSTWVASHMYVSSSIWADTVFPLLHLWQTWKVTIEALMMIKPAGRYKPMCSVANVLKRLNIRFWFPLLRTWHDITSFSSRSFNDLGHVSITLFPMILINGVSLSIIYYQCIHRSLATWSFKKAILFGCSIWADTAFALLHLRQKSKVATLIWGIGGGRWSALSANILNRLPRSGSDLSCWEHHSMDITSCTPGLIILVMYRSHLFPWYSSFT